MGLTSEQAKAMNAQPRITPEERDRLIHLLAEGKKPAELALQFGKAVGTIYNFQTRNKDAIDALRRKRTVQFDHLAWVRKQARLDSLEKVGNTGEMLMRAHLASCFATDPITGQQEFVERLVDSKKLKDYADMIFKAARGIMIETGQQLRLDEKWTEKALGVDGRNGVDYPALVEAQAQWEAGAPLRAAKRAQEKAARDQWFDEDWVASMVCGGESRERAVEIVQAQRDRKNGLGPEEVRRRAWERRRTAGYAELVEGLELFCEDWVTRDMDGNPKHLDAEGLERERVHLKKYWFPDDDAAHARVDCFLDSWRYLDAEDVDEVPVVAASPTDEPIAEEQDMDVEIVRMMPPRKPAEEPVRESAPEPEHDQVEPLRGAFIRALADGRTASDDELMRELRCSAAEFYAVLGELIDDGVVVEDRTGIRLTESSVAVA